VSLFERKITRRQVLEAAAIIPPALIMYACGLPKTKREPVANDNLANIAQNAILDVLTNQFPAIQVNELKNINNNDEIDKLPEIETDQEEYLKAHGIQSFSIGYNPTSSELLVHFRTSPGSKIGQTFKNTPTPWPSFLVVSDTVIQNPQKGALLRVATIATTGYNFEIDQNTPNVDGNLNGMSFKYPIEKSSLEGKNVIVAFAADLINFNGQPQPKLYLPGIFQVSPGIKKA